VLLNVKWLAGGCLSVSLCIGLSIDLLAALFAWLYVSVCHFVHVVCLHVLRLPRLPVHMLVPDSLYVFACTCMFDVCVCIPVGMQVHIHDVAVSMCVLIDTFSCIS